MITKILELALNQKHLREKFIREIRANGLKAAIKKVMKKASEKFSDTNQPPKDSKKNQSNETFYDQLFSQTGVSETFIPLDNHSLIQTTDIKLIAFYLPQFHPISQNDSNWGKGFTEWTNVSKAVPQYAGHHQPKLPGELGFYDLRLIENQKRQIELAKAYGIYGFCYHHYWFDGKRIMNTPIEQLLSHPELNFPFCINWANENWTKKWDGYDSDVILSQSHSESDDIAFIADTARYMKDPRYIRIDGKPLLMLYRPALLPNAKETAQRWRNWCRENGIGEIYLVMTHSFEHIDPKMIDFDTAVEFAPNSFPLRDITEDMKSKIINPSYQGTLYDYDSAIKISDDFQTPSYKKFRGVCPRWDNEARKPGKGTTLVGSTPEKYEHWLRNICNYTQKTFKPSEQFVFINAWNEWAEGAYLEPDRKYGYAYLEATRNALTENLQTKKILYVSHDAHFHGAQILSLNIVRTLKEVFQFDVHMIVKSGGQLENDFSKYATVYNLEKEYVGEKAQTTLMKTLRHNGITHAICNTVVSGDVLGKLSDLGFKTISLIHELPNLIRQYHMEKNAEIISNKADHIVFPSSFVAEKFNTIAKVPAAKAIVRPQGLYQINPYENDLDTARKNLREELGLDQNCKIVLGAGFADHRKGFDIFVKSAEEVRKQLPNVYFVWVGNIEISMHTQMASFIKQCENLILIPAQKEISLFYSGADLYLMTSREDPFPSVVMEAMNVKVPVIGFENAGGFQDIITEETGILVPFENELKLQEAIITLIEDDLLRQKYGESSSILIKNTFLWKDYIYDILNLIGFYYKKVSVIVPNYNYERYILERLQSIENQTYPIYELIYLDDCSKDGSLSIAKEFQKQTKFDMKIIENTTNSGSVFNQWFKGIDLAKGEYIWIAEADDLCESNFLETAMQGFKKENVVLSFTQSKQIDENGNLIALSYHDYVREINSEKWKKNYFNIGTDEIQTSLAIKNTIPNVSGVIFKNLPIADDFRNNLVNYKIAGDWMFYIWLCTQGNITFNAKSLNIHRRHSQSVTTSENSLLHYNEVVTMQHYIIDNFSLSDNVKKQIEKYRHFLHAYLQIT